jgi:hypothetical protein
MRGGKTSWPRIAFVLAVAAGLGSVSALGQSPATPGSSRVSKAQGAVPIDLPEPRRITVAARPVARGEIAVFDPITVTIAPAHIPPKDLAVVNPARLTVSAGKEVVVIDVPSPPKVVVSVLNQAPKPVLVPEPLRTAAAISRRAPTATPVTEALNLQQVEVGANRDPLPTIEISDPIATAVGANRVPLSVVDAEAAIAACDFEGVRAYLRALVAVSDQLDSDGRKVVAELSRLNRANTAFEAARLRYDDGRLDEANTLLVLAEKTQCEAREKKVEVVLSKIDRLQKAIWKIDEAIMGCNIPTCCCRSAGRSSNGWPSRPRSRPRKAASPRPPWSMGDWSRRRATFRPPKSNSPNFRTNSAVLTCVRRLPRSAPKSIGSRDLRAAPTRPSALAISMA